MPLSRRDLFQFSVLLLCVPLQYLICAYWSSDIKQRDYLASRFFVNTYDLTTKYFEWKTWENLWLNSWRRFKSLLNHEPYSSNYSDEDMGESPAFEVMKFKSKNGYFTNSPEVRYPRPVNVNYRIGQVIVHKTWGYRGVIIGWDKVAKAPEAWLNAMHPADKKQWREMPNYAILVDVRDRPDPQITYVPEENLRYVANTKIEHPTLEDYFYEYDGAVYLPRPWLRALYPAD